MHLNTLGPIAFLLLIITHKETWLENPKLVRLAALPQGYVHITSLAHLRRKGEVS